MATTRRNLDVYWDPVNQRETFVGRTHHLHEWQLLEAKPLTGFDQSRRGTQQRSELKPRKPKLLACLRWWAACCLGWWVLLTCLKACAGDPRPPAAPPPKPSANILLQPVFGNLLVQRVAIDSQSGRRLRLDALADVQHLANHLAFDQ